MPEVQQVHLDAALTNVSVAYTNTDYIAEKIAPSVPVRKQSDRYFIYDSNREVMRPSQDLRSPGAEANEVDFTLSQDSYFCDDHALVSAVPDEERANADPVIQPDIDRVEFLSDRIALNREIQLESLLRTNSSIPGQTIAGGDTWNNDSSDPLSVLRTARLTVFSGCQRRANTVVLPFNIYEVLRNHPAITQRVVYSNAGIIDEKVLAQLLDVENVIVARACKNTAARGQVPVIDAIWGRNVYVMHVPNRAALKQVAAAYTFLWTGMPGNQHGNIVEKWREPRRKADLVRVQKYYDHKIVAPSAVYRIINAISA